jgi:hypothetical protein
LKKVLSKLLNLFLLVVAIGERGLVAVREGCITQPGASLACGDDVVLDEDGVSIAGS